MRINDIIPDKQNNIKSESWNPDDPVNSLSSPADWYDRTLIKMLSDFDRIRNAGTLSNHEAELLIATNNSLTEAIIQYRYDNTPLPKDAGLKLVSIMKRITPVDKTFYRGVEFETQDDKHIMPIQSWATSVKVASYFGDIIYQTVGKVQGVELSSIFYYNQQVFDHESNGLTESMGEWFLLNPKKEIIE